MSDYFLYIMEKEWIIGYKRIVKIWKTTDNYAILIREESSEKFIQLTAQRWNNLMDLREAIDENVQKVLNEVEPVNFRRHLGGGVYVSVTSGIKCVDVRLFYPNRNLGPRPTQSGFAFRLPEWTSMKLIMEEINKQFPELINYDSCFLRGDHNNQEVNYFYSYINEVGNGDYKRCSLFSL